MSTKWEKEVANFGKDMGLVHQTVITGRKVGAGPSFWGWLAVKPSLLAACVKLVAEDLKLTKEERQLIQKWLGTLKKSSWPMPESRGYYAAVEEGNDYYIYWG